MTTPSRPSSPSPDPSTHTTRTGLDLGLAGWWGLAGTVALLVDAIVRLALIALEPLRAGGLSAGVAAAYVLSTAFMAYTEGYRGFQLRFSPRAVARLRVMDRVPGWVRWLAPLYCMGLVYATRRRLIASWLLLTGIVTLIVLIRGLDQPWRGAVDAGVVVGLTWGLASLLYELLRPARAGADAVDPELPR